MSIVFEKLSEKHQKGVMSVFNYYCESSTAAFPTRALPEPFFGMLLKQSEGFPAYAVLDDEAVIGFCRMSAYNPLPSFKKTACITYFLSPDYTGKGIGAECLKRLEDGAREMGIQNIIAEISSENEQSIAFHEKNGFIKVGELPEIAEKLGRAFGITLMLKKL